jgi:hypothetical protein
MTSIVTLESKFVPSEDVVAREIEGELVIIPLTSGIGDMEDELYTLNDSGKAIWDRLDGKRSLSNIINELIAEYVVERNEIEVDVIGLVNELVKRKMLLLIEKD